MEFEKESEYLEGSFQVKFILGVFNLGETGVSRQITNSRHECPTGKSRYLATTLTRNTHLEECVQIGLEKVN